MTSETSFRRDFYKEMVISSVIKILKSGQKSIVELCKEMNIPRSTLVHYLTLMEIRGHIEKKRIEHKATGRPTMISLKKEFIEKMQHSQDNLNELNKKILSFLQNKVTERELINKFELQEKAIPMFAVLIALENRGYLSKYYEITDKGKAWLKDNDKPTA